MLEMFPVGLTSIFRPRGRASGNVWVGFLGDWKPPSRGQEVLPSDGARKDELLARSSSLSNRSQRSWEIWNSAGLSWMVASESPSPGTVISKLKSASLPPCVSPTPSTFDALDLISKPSRPKKSKWQTASASLKVTSKFRVNHNASHQMMHRAQEKIGFGVAESCLLRTSEALAGWMESRAPSTAKKLSGVAKVRKWMARVVNRLKGKSTLAEAEASAVHAAHGAHGAHGAASGGLFFLPHLALPILGTYLLTHMAHHGLHRAQRERRERGLAITTCLFYVGTLCDALDAVAHVVIVLCMVMDSGVFNHHLEHELHEGAMYVALLACVAMVIGEALAGDDHGHASHSAKVH